MTTQTEALKLADALNELLESFEKDGKFCKSSSIRNEFYDRLKQTLEESKEALAQPKQEPVAWITQSGKGWLRWHKSYDDNKDSVPLYTTPPQRTWVGLTDAEIDQGLLRTNYAMQTARAWRDGVRWAYHQLKEKNNA